MRKTLQSCALAVFVIFSTAYSCHSQNGPNPPQAIATWIQAVPTSSSGPVTANSVYRCSPSPCSPAPPAIYTSTAPVTTYTDGTIVAGTSYVYAVTAHFGAVEGPYSNNSAPYSWAFSAPTFGAVTGSLVPQAQAQDMVAAVKRPKLRHEPICGKCSTVSSLVVTNQWRKQ
jgi:hypothetical protein